MSILKHYADNPSDGNTTFNKVRFYRANDALGTGATLIGTSDIDLTTVTPLNPGFTSYNDLAGDLTKYYSATWYDSVSGAESDHSDYVLGGQDRLDTRFMDEMQDNEEEVFSANDRERFKIDAIQALYPDFFRNVIDTSLSVVNLAPDVTYIYTVPFGIFSISEVGYGNLNTTSTENRNFKLVKTEYWKFEKNQLRFDQLPPWNNNDPIRLVAQKKYLDIGEIPVYLDSLLILHMQMSAYLKLASDFPRFLKWGQLQQGSKVSFENLRVHAREYERKFTDLKKQLKDASLASLQ